MSKDNKEFNQGVIWACARLIEMHDRPEYAIDVLLEANIHDSELKDSAEYDNAFLRKGSIEIPEGKE